MNTYTIYVLLLEENKYYIGKSKNHINRINAHFNGEGSSWTKKYKPINVVETIENQSAFDEDKYVLIYMDKYGIDNVRGGTFTDVKLKYKTKEIINKMLQSVNDKCYKCNRSGHFANKCNQTYKNSYVMIDNHENTLIDNLIIDTDNKLVVDEDTKSIIDVFENGLNPCCYICKRNTHIANECYAKTDVNGELLSHEDKECCYRCGRYGHYMYKCNEKKDIYNKYITGISNYMNIPAIKSECNIV